MDSAIAYTKMLATDLIAIRSGGPHPARFQVPTGLLTYHSLILARKINDPLRVSNIGLDLRSYSAAAVEIFVHWLYTAEIPNDLEHQLFVESNAQPFTHGPSILTDGLHAWSLFNEMSMPRAKNEIMTLMYRILKEWTRTRRFSIKQSDVEYVMEEHDFHVYPEQRRLQQFVLGAIHKNCLLNPREALTNRFPKYAVNPRFMSWWMCNRLSWEVSGNDRQKLEDTGGVWLWDEQESRWSLYEARLARDARGRKLDVFGRDMFAVRD